jgi:hypothetical protein
MECEEWDFLMIQVHDGLDGARVGVNVEEFPWQHLNNVVVEDGVRSGIGVTGFDHQGR